MAHISNKTLISFLLITLLLIPTRAHANFEAFVAAGIEAWPEPDSGSHAIILAAIRANDIFSTTDLEVIFNTETLRLRLNSLCINSKLCLQLEATGERGFAGLLPDYYRQGILIEEQGFEASYIQGLLGIQYEPAAGHYLGYRSEIRKWFFDRLDETSPDLVLPPDFTSISQYLSYAFWKLKDGYQWNNYHIARPKLDGYVFGITLGLESRLQNGNFGFNDPRNQADDNILSFHQYAGFGKNFGRIRLQLLEQTRTAQGEDDISRARIGGLNQYVVTIAGIPWAAFLSSHYVQLKPLIALSLIKNLELNASFDFVALPDRRRNNDNTWGAVYGLSSSINWRPKNWDIDVSFGYAPKQDWMQQTPHISIFGWIGRKFQF